MISRKYIFNTAIFSLAFFWAGLQAAPESGDTASLIRTGLVGSVAIVVGFGFVILTSRLGSTKPSN